MDMQCAASQTPVELAHRRISQIFAQRPMKRRRVMRLVQRKHQDFTQTIPQDVWTSCVMDYLSWVEILRNVALVNRDFRVVARSPNSIKEICITTAKMDFLVKNPKTFEKLARQCHNIKTLTISPSNTEQHGDDTEYQKQTAPLTHISVRFAATLAQHITNLRVLHLQANIADKPLSLILDANKKIESLELPSYSLKSMNILEKLSVERLEHVLSYEMSLDVLFGLVKNFKNFSSFDVERVEGFSDDDVKIIAESCPNLKYFILHESPHISNRGIKHLTNLPLKKVVIGGTSLITDGALETIANIKTLVGLSLRDCPAITDVGVKALAKKSGSQFKAIGLNSNPQLTNQTMVHIGKHCDNLEYLEIYDCDKIDDLGLCFVCKGCKRIQEMHLGGIALTQSAIQIMSHLCTTLKTVVVPKNSHIMCVCQEPQLKFLREMNPGVGVFIDP